MNTINPPVGPRTLPTPRAGSLRRTAASYLRALWDAMERFGQRRAARELWLAADRIQAGRPELAAQLRALSRESTNV